jgi:predicted transcriptional regulator of viral defense system
VNVSEYIKQLQSFEEYAFSWSEILMNCNVPEPTLRKELIRLSEKNEIINLRQGFYLIIPPRYQKFGKLPVQLYVEKLFKHLQKTYYIGLYSAAAIHGASHQRIQQDYIMTVPPALRDINKDKTKLRFFKSERWPELNIIEKKSDAGLYKVSSPALTAMDLIHQQSKIGGINRMLANLEELAHEITDKDLDDLLSWYPYKSTLQRFGYIMEALEVREDITKHTFDKLKQESFYPVLLSPKKGMKPGKTGNRWKVDVNIKLENDL